MVEATNHQDEDRALACSYFIKLNDVKVLTHDSPIENFQKSEFAQLIVKKIGTTAPRTKTGRLMV